MKKLFFPILILLFMLSLSSSCKKDENGDKNKPFILVTPPNPQYWGVDIPYEDAGAEAYDITDTGDTIDVTNRLQTTNNVNIQVTGDYQVLYNVSDEAGNNADQQSRDVKVILTK